MSKDRNIVLLESLSARPVRWYTDTYGFFTSILSPHGTLRHLLGIEKDDGEPLYHICVTSNLLFPIVEREDDLEHFESQKIRCVAGHFMVGDREIKTIGDYVSYAHDLRKAICMVPCELYTYIAFGVFVRLVEGKSLTQREIETLILRVMEVTA
jgi:hypothetical protein